MTPLIALASSPSVLLRNHVALGTTHRFQLMVQIKMATYTTGHASQFASSITSGYLQTVTKVEGDGSSDIDTEIESVVMLINGQQTRTTPKHPRKANTMHLSPTDRLLKAGERPTAFGGSWVDCPKDIGIGYSWPSKPVSVGASWTSHGALGLDDAVVRNKLIRIEHRGGLTLAHLTATTIIDGQRLRPLLTMPEGLVIPKSVEFSVQYLFDATDGVLQSLSTTCKFLIRTDAGGRGTQPVPVNGMFCDYSIAVRLLK